MIVGIGTDIVDVPRIEASAGEYGERFLRRVFTPLEIEYCERFGASKYLHYAARFAAKEAFSKAIGTGMRNGMAFGLVGVRNEPSGKPVLELFGAMHELYHQHTIHLTLSHSATIAVAVVVIESRS